MHGRDNYLFSDFDLDEALRNNIENAKKDVESIPAEQFNLSDDAALVEHVYSKREVIPLELHVDAMEMEQQETKVDVRNDTRRWIPDRSQPCYVPGIAVTVSIPFSGDAELWKYKTNTYHSSPPRAIVRSSDRDNNSGHVDIDMKHPSDTGVPPINPRSNAQTLVVA